METNLNQSIDFNTIETEKLINENDFPTHIFPPIFSDLITDLKDSLNFPTDYTGTAILTAISTAIGTSAKVKVKETWYEYASLYTALIGNAGANKTHPVNQMFGVLRDIDKVAINKHTGFKFQLNNFFKKTKAPMTNHWGFITHINWILFFNNS